MTKRSHQETSIEEAPLMADMGKNLEGGGDDNMDELLAVLGYKVRSSDMADVAQKLEQLEMVLTNDAASNALNDTVHYNPSDLSEWAQTMLSEINYYQPLSPDLNPTRICSEFDLRPILDDDECCSSSNSSNKRIRLDPWCDSVSSESTRPVLLFVDSQETGVRLVQALLACAEAVQLENLSLADALVKQVGSLAASQAGAMGKVATFFAEALARRIYRIHLIG